MKHKLYLLCLACLAPILLFGQKNYTQELINLLDEGKCFEAFNYKEKYKDSIPNDRFFNLYYQYNMSRFFNKTDSAAIYLEEMTRPEYETIWNQNIGGIQGTLLRMYDDLQQYDNAIALCDDMIDYYKRNPFGLSENTLKNEIEFAKNVQSAIEKKAKVQPLIRIEYGETPSEVPLCNIDSSLIHFEAEYNGKSITTLFDTGVSFYLTMNKSLADSLGVKVYDVHQDSIRIINDIPLKAINGVIDSIKIGAIRLYNIPALIFSEEYLITNLSDSLLKIPYVNNNAKLSAQTTKMIMGLPLMSLIGQFEFDWTQKTMTLSYPTSKAADKRNLYTWNGVIYTQLQINKLNCNVNVDTGMKDTFFILDDLFYNNNKNSILKTDLEEKIPDEYYYSHTVAGIEIKKPMGFAENADIIYNKKKIPHTTKEVPIGGNPFTHIKNINGSVGVNFFKRLGAKTIIDFVNMRMDGLGEKQKNYQQELINQLNLGRFPESRDFMEQYKDSILSHNNPSLENEFINLYYHSNLAYFLNKPDSIIYYWSEIIKQKYEPIWNINRVNANISLLKLYYKMQKYDNAIQICDSIIDYYNRNPFKMPDNFIQKEIGLANKQKFEISEIAKTLPKMKIVYRKTSSKTNLYTNKTALIYFDAEYNGNPTKTLFDTGFDEFFVINSNKAKKMGVKKYPFYSNDTIVEFKDVKMVGYTGILDSIRVPNITLYNVPVLVLNMDSSIHESILIDSTKINKLKNYYQHFDISMGLKTMKLIGKIVVDSKKNKLYCLSDENNIKTDEQANTYLFAGRLFTNLVYNNLNIHMIVDTGIDGYLRFNPRFYMENKELITNCLYINFKEETVPHSLKEHMTVINDSLLNWNSIYPDSAEGAIGCGFLKDLRHRIMFDFYNMRIDILK